MNCMVLGGFGGIVYGYLWGALVYILCWVLARPCMWMCWWGMCIVLAIPRLWCLRADCIDCQHLLGYSILFVCWIEVCGLFGVLLCYVGLCKGFLCVGGCEWRVVVAMYQCRGLGKVCNWGWDMLVVRRCSLCGFPCIGRIGISRFVQFVHKICIRLSRSSSRVFLYSC